MPHRRRPPTPQHHTPKNSSLPNKHHPKQPSNNPKTTNSGAAKGEGLGNAFLSHISAVDGIFHVCRAFEDPDVTHVEDRIDPVADLDIIHAELRAKDVERLDSCV